MRRELPFFLLSLALHAPLLWTARSRVPASVSAETGVVLWQAPPVRGARTSSSRRIRGAGQGPSSGAAGLPSEWRTLGEMAADGNRPPTYPPEALDREWEGTVGLKIDFSEAGEAVGVSVEKSSGFPVLDRAALEAARSWRIRGADRVRQVRVPVRFELSEEG